MTTPRLRRWVPRVTWDNVSDIEAEHDIRHVPSDHSTTTWCQTCGPRIPGGYLEAVRHAAILGHVVEVRTVSSETIATFDALLDAELREANGR